MKTVEQVIDEAREVLALRARADAREVEFLVSLDDGSTSDSEERRQRAEALAPELRLTPHEVLNRIHTALALTHRMPRLLDAMRDGQVDRYGAERVLNVVAPVSDDDARVVDQLLLDKLATMNMSAWQPRNMAWHASKLVQDIDPGAVESAARMARDARKVVLDHWPNAMSRLSAELPSEVAQAIYTRIDVTAHRLHRAFDDRTLDQCRADVFANVLLGNEPMIDRPEPAVMVYLHMPVDTALSISETGAEIDGIGPIPGPLAREIMTNPRSIWRKVICDPATGNPVDLGRSSYRPNATIRKLVQVRDRMCVVPWCRRPARHCDIDHQQEWAKDQGPTSIDNAGPRCRKHHRMKNAPGWINHYDPVHGTTSVTTPFGVTYDGKREPVLNPKSSNPGETPDSPAGDASGAPPDDDPPPF